MIKLVIAEDQGMILGALARLLDMEPDIDVVGQAGTGNEALTLVRQLKPDVVLTDIEMPGLSGLDVAQQIATMDHPPAVLIVTTFGRPGYLRRAMDAGVKGYLLKDSPSEKLADAVRQVALGRRVIAPELMDAAWAGTDPLSNRERQVLRLAEQGQNSKQIAATLGLSPGTTRNYIHEAAAKLGVNNRIEAARIARAKGWL